MNSNNNDQNVDEYFEDSEGGGIDNENLTNPETGVGFDSGTNNIFIAPEPNNYEPNNYEYEPEEYEYEFETEFFPDINYLNTLNLDDLRFDSEYYLEQNPDAAETDIGVITHFIQIGVPEDRKYRFYLPTDYIPSSNIDISVASDTLFLYDLKFDSEYYLEYNPDVAAADIDAITHFSQFGISEDREHRYVFRENSSDFILQIDLENHFQVSLNLENNFQTEFYDNSTTGFNPIYNSNETSVPLGFDSEYYLEQNSDVAAAGIDPYDHYISFGQAEGRNPNAYSLDFGDYDLVDNLAFPQTIELTNTNNLDFSNDFV